jgi:hypothetical protein
MLPFGVTVPAAVPQKSKIPEGLTNYHVYMTILIYGSKKLNKMRPNEIEKALGQKML